MFRRAFLYLIVSTIFIGATFLALEVGVRLMCKRDLDGDRLFCGTLRLKPYHFPLRKTTEAINEYERRKNEARIQWDANLGWSLRARAAGCNQEGFYSSDPAPAKKARPGILRIALFGGSYTMGGGESGWWKVLERKLNESGVPAEVLNFGVDGYGMDQAYLRWQQQGRTYSPDIVLFGFYVGNCRENLNLIRMLLQQLDSGIPFTKPRFTLEKGGLKLLNVPTVSPEKTPELMGNPEKWELIQYEHFYHPEDYAFKIWRASSVAALIEAKLQNYELKKMEANDWIWSLGGDSSKLGLGIIKQFHQEVEGSGSHFASIHLPHHSDLKYFQEHGRFAYQELYNTVKTIAPVVETEGPICAKVGARPIESFYQNGHFGADLDEVIGECAAEALISKIENGRWLRAKESSPNP